MSMNATFAAGVFGCLFFVCLTCAGLAEEQKWYHPKTHKLASPHMGPYANLPDGSVVAVSERHALVSKDEGKTWAPQALFGDDTKFLARPERALLRTRSGALIMGFLNEKEIARGEWKVDDKAALSKFHLPTYVARSLDDGKTWEPPQKIQDGWCGAIRSMIQLKSGRASSSPAATSS